MWRSIIIVNKVHRTVHAKSNQTGPDRTVPYIVCSQSVITFNKCLFKLICCHPSINCFECKQTDECVYDYVCLCNICARMRLLMSKSLIIKRCCAIFLYIDLYLFALMRFCKHSYQNIRALVCIYMCVEKAVIIFYHYPLSFSSNSFQKLKFTCSSRRIGMHQ